MRFYSLVMVFAAFHITVLRGEIYRVCDLWTSDPLDSIQVVLNGDTIKLADDGLLSVKNRPSIELFRAGYFKVRLNLKEFSGRIIYMEPVSSTEPVMVVREAASGQAVVLPAHADRLQLDTERRQGNSDLASALEKQSGIFIKSYGGSGQLQTIALRGMSAEQTQILLDGVPVNSLQLGSVDLGQFALFSISEAEIYRGGNALFSGSGAIGGTINLHPARLSNRFNYRLFASLASFGNQEYGISLQIPIAGFEQNLSYLRQNGVNDYTTDFEGESIRLQNRDFTRKIIQYQAGRTVGRHIRFGLLVHNIGNEAGAPKALISARSEKANRARITEDRTLLKIYSTISGKQGQLKLSGFVRNDWMEYRDPMLLVDGRILHSRHFNHEAGASVHGRYLPLSCLLINGGLEMSWQAVHSSAAGDHSRKRTAAFIMADWQVYNSKDLSSDWHINASLRAESYSGYEALLLPGIGLSYLRGVFKAYTSAGKNYRAPSFNDLYWQPGGNPRLLPERSVNWEAGVGYEDLLSGLVHVKAEAAYFTNRVTNLIKWQPDNQLWIPHNIGEVFSKGLELDLILGSADNRHALQVKYTRSNSRKNKAEFPGDRTVGNQLPYLPGEQVILSLRGGLASLSAGVEGSYMSFRYKTLQNDPGQIMPSVAVWRFWLSYEVVWLKQQFNLMFKIENIFRSDYQIISGYPMPPRQFGVQLEATLDGSKE